MNHHLPRRVSPDALQEERVRSVVIKAHETFVGNPIRDFVTVFVSVPRVTS